MAKRLNVAAYRVYDHDLPEFPLSIEFYNEKLYVAEYQRKHQLDDYLYHQWMSESKKIIQEVLHVSDENIYMKLRKKITNRQEQYEKLDDVDSYFTVVENGLNFAINLTDYLDTGLFLDHRDTRQKVRMDCAGKKVLNLFSYTGSFTVYAAAGGAAEVVSVDMSRKYSEWTTRNLELNNLVSDSVKVIQADVMQYLEREKSNYYDIIILDPPTYSNSKRMKEEMIIQEDYIWLVNECLRCKKDDGYVIFSNNFTQFELQPRYLNATSVEDIKDKTTPFDFEGKLRRWCWEIR
jgi:23S rRNA (cytosine1962-C5)-methyltransferase